MAAQKINRRGFMKSAATVAAATVGFPYLIPSSALGKNGTVAPSNRIVIGGIGVGSMGTGDLNGFLSHKEIQVAAVCDVDKIHRDRAKGIVDKKQRTEDCATYLDYRDLIARGDLDAVFTALPDQWHAVVATEAARAGLDVHGQKPLARTIRQGRAICDAVDRYGVIWQTGSQQRSSWQFYRAVQLVRNGRIGKVKYAEVGLPNGRGSGVKKLLDVPDTLNWGMWLGPAPWRPYQDFGRGSCHWDWRWIMDYSGGQLTDWAGHHIDIAHWGLGLERTGPIEIEGKGVYPKDGLYDVPTEYKFSCKYKNGVKLVVANQSQQPRGMGACWYGENGQWIYVSRGGLWASDPKILKEVIGPNEISVYKSPGHKQNFIDSIKSRKETICPAEVGHRSISVGLLGEIAMLTGRKLKWDPDKEIFANDAQANSLLERPMTSPWHI